MGHVEPKSHAQKRNGGLDENRRRHFQRGGHDDDAQHVGQDVARHDAVGTGRIFPAASTNSMRLIDSTDRAPCAPS